MRSGKTLPQAVTLIGMLLAAFTGSSVAQTVQRISVEKARSYTQTSPTSVAINSTCSPLSVCPYDFRVSVVGQNLASIPAPVLSGPVNVAALGANWNNGHLVYNQGAWIGAARGNNFGFPTPAILDANFGSGTYTLVVSGASVALNLAGDAYPTNVPVLTLGGGRWLNDTYVVDATKPFTFSTNGFTDYGTHLDDRIAFLGNSQYHSTTPGSNSLSATVPANTLVNGVTYSAGANFTAIVDVNPQPSLPGSRNFAGYTATTFITIKAEAPIFPITVNANIGPTVSSATANIQYRPQDVGSVGSVFVFAHVPASLLGIAVATQRMPFGPTVPTTPLDGSNPCVLAQLNPNGQLVPVSASTMQPYISGVLGAQGQALTILNNHSTPSIAGAAFYVGYGPNAGAMLANGVYQGAVTIPGASQCTAGAAPNSPDALTGLWWNANEAGWGIHLTKRGSNVFAAWYTYDGAGNPKWYVATCAAASATAGTCSGTLYQVTGPNFFGGAFNPSLVNATEAGTLQINFASASAVSMTYTGVAGQTRTVALTRQPLATGTTPPAVDYSDLWWDPSESGWGMAMAQQYGVTFLAWYVYDASGRPTWLVATCTMNGSSCTGTLYRTTGPAFGPTFDTNGVHASSAGTVTVDFTDANNANVSYTVDGVKGSKAITRQLF